MILLSHPTGNQNSRQAALAFREADLLHGFFTAAHFNAQGVLARLAPERIRVELARRDFAEVAPASHIQSVARVRESVRTIAAKAKWQSLIEREAGWASVDKVYRAVDHTVARQLVRGDNVRTAYAYEDGALETFKAAQARGIARIYELPIGYWRAHRYLCAEEARLRPQWAHTWHANMDSDEKVQRKDTELALASRVIVPSRFVAETLKEYPGTLPPVSVIPYGCPPPIASNARNWYSSEPLKVLFVGGLSQRKGLSYLLDAVQPLGDAVSLTLIGTGAGAGKELLGTRHRLLGSVPHSVVLEEMRRHDVFVFPSLFEGFGMVITEALARGMPVIITPACGPADMIEDGKQGWIVPIRDSVTITRRLQQCIDAPETVSVMGKAALELAASWTWAHYRQRLREVVLERDGERTA